MRIGIYNLMLMVPVAIAGAVFFLLKDSYVSVLRQTFVKGKEPVYIPDFQVVDIGDVLKEARVLAEIKVVTREEEDLYEEEDKALEPPNYRLTFTFVGKRRYAIIDGNLYREGDKLKYERLIKVEKNRVLLDGRWGKRWVYLLDR